MDLNLHSNSNFEPSSSCRMAGFCMKDGRPSNLCKNEKHCEWPWSALTIIIMVQRIIKKNLTILQSLLQLIANPAMSPFLEWWVCFSFLTITRNNACRVYIPHLWCCFEVRSCFHFLLLRRCCWRCSVVDEMVWTRTTGVSGHFCRIWPEVLTWERWRMIHRIVLSWWSWSI